MFWSAIQLWDLIVYHRMHFFFIFSCYVWIIFLIKFLSARKYKPFKGEVPALSTSAVVVVFREKIDDFKRCLVSLKRQERLNEIIVVIDKRDTGKYEELLTQMNIRYSYAPPGKRKAIAKGIKLTSGDIIFVVDSDSILSGEKVVKEMLKPFNDPKVGGVTPTQRIYKPSTIFDDIADWMEDSRWKISNRAMSAKGCIGCLPGRVLAFRREVIEPHLDEFLNETFLGRRCITGDDRYLTSITLREGYKAVYQSTATIYTTCPNGFLNFVKMHLRWARSSQRETLKALRWYLKKPFILPFSFITDIITPFFFMIVLIYALVNMILHFDPVLLIEETFYDSALIGLTLGYVGMNISLGLRQIPHLRNKKEDIPFLFFWTLFMTFVMMPIRIVGFFTMTKQDWMTRDANILRNNKDRIGRLGSWKSLLLILLLVCIPFSVLVLFLISAVSAYRITTIYG